MTDDDQLRAACILAIARSAGTVTLRRVAQDLGILPSLGVSIDAGRPYAGDGSDYSDLPASGQHSASPGVNTDRAQIAALGKGGKG